jgi:hypothetical protein
MNMVTVSMGPDISAATEPPAWNAQGAKVISTQRPTIVRIVVGEAWYNDTISTGTHKRKRKKMQHSAAVPSVE